MLDGVLQKLKKPLKSWMARFKQIQDMFSTAKDVYGALLGVDIDDSSVISIQLSNLVGVTRLTRLGAAALLAGTIVDDAIIDPPQLATAFRHMVSGAKISAKNVALAMPGSKVAIREIKIPSKLSDQEAENKAWKEARRAFPELAKNLYLDFVQIASPPNEYTLMIVCCRQDDILPRVEAVKPAGLIPKIMEVDYYALERAYFLFASQLPKVHVNQYVACIDFNPHSVLFLVMHQKQVIYHVRQIYAGDALVPLVQQAMQLDTSAAKAKPAVLKPIADTLKTPAQATPAHATGIVDDQQKTHVLMTIRRLFQAFYTENAGKVIRHIAWSGRCALIPDLGKYLEETLEIPVTRVNPLKALKLGERVDANYAMKIGPACTLSCGLALRGIPLWK